MTLVGSQVIAAGSAVRRDHRELQASNRVQNAPRSFPVVLFCCNAQTPLFSARTLTYVVWITSLVGVYKGWISVQGSESPVFFSVVETKVNF